MFEAMQDVRGQIRATSICFAFPGLTHGNVHSKLPLLLHNKRPQSRTWSQDQGVLDYRCSKDEPRRTAAPADGAVRERDGKACTPDIVEEKHQLGRVGHRTEYLVSVPVLQERPNVEGGALAGPARRGGAQIVEKSGRKQRLSLTAVHGLMACSR